jgi:Lon protease-like protein
MVLLPRAVLPLHIFEDRYRRMTADALTGARQIAMALPTTPPTGVAAGDVWAVEPVVCIGRIIKHERMEDGRYNLLLEGACRATIVREFDDKPYRQAELAPLPETPVLEIDLAEQRRRLTQFFADNRVRESDVLKQLVRLMHSNMATAELADVFAYALIGDAAVKQQLLADGDVRRRVTTAIRVLHELNPAIPKSAQGKSGCAMN